MRHAERLALAAHIGRCRGRHELDAWMAELPPNITVPADVAEESLQLLEEGQDPYVLHHDRPEPLAPVLVSSLDPELTKRTGLPHEQAVEIANEAHKKAWRIAAKKFYRKFLPK